MLSDEQREAWANHGIIGTQKGKQGAGQLVPEDLVLCWSCGWMRGSEYHEHLALLIERWISQARGDRRVREVLAREGTEDETE